MSDPGRLPARGAPPFLGGAALVTAGRELVWVRGPDTVSFLDGLLSRSLPSLPAGAVARALLLSPRGRLRAALWLLVGLDEVGIVTDAGHGAVVAGDLARFRLRVDVTIDPEPHQVIDLWGPEAAAVAQRAAGIEVTEPVGWQAVPGGGIVARTPFLHVEVPRYAVVGVDRGALVAAGAEPLDPDAAEGFRIEAGEPGSAETGGEPIPEETGLVAASVDFDKGCFLGQELVARIASRGHVNRRLVGLAAPGDAALEGVVRWKGREVGEVTSAGTGRDGRSVALAMIRVEVEAGAEVEVVTARDPVVATVRALPGDVPA